MKARVKILSTTIDPENIWMADIGKLLSVISEIKEQNERILAILNRPSLLNRLKLWVKKLFRRN